MRISVFLFSLFVSLSATIGLRAEDPGAQQDAEAAREKILKAADQIDMIESNSEASKPALEAMKADIAKLQTDNAALKQQLADLQTAFDQAQAAHAKEQKALVDTIAGMIASNKSNTTKSHKKKDAPEAKAPESDTTSSSASLSTNAASTSTATASSTTDAATPNSETTLTKPQKGYYHIVASGETLSLISTAYRQGGVNVTVSEIQKANGLTDKSVLKVGQKLFIPKPGN